MTDLNELKKQREELDARIRAEEQAAKVTNVATVLRVMGDLGVTWADLGVAPVANARAGAKRAVKYRDEKGNTWTGVGQRPVWLRERLAAGATLDQFAVKV